MKRKWTWGYGWSLVALCALMAACAGKNDAVAGGGQYIPEEPDYGDSTFWYVREAAKPGTGADVFYLVSTWEKDWVAEDGRVCHYADVHRAEHRGRMAIEIGGVAECMGDGNNFYSPYYRHITIEAWATLNEDTVNNRFRLSFDDLQQAFNVFLQRRAPGRPFVLAGFSQGGKAVVELLKAMPEGVRGDLVAAYVLGYKVTPADTLASDNIRAAQDSTDTGVTVCYNSVSDIRYIQPMVAAPCAMCINPVNWRTDSIPATLRDTITVAVSPQHQVLVLHGYSGSEYSPIMGFLNVGDFHSCEPWLYQECLRKNIKARVEAFRRQHPGRP